MSNIGLNFTPKRRAAVVTKWVREELNMKKASRKELAAAVRYSNWETLPKLVEKVYGKESAKLVNTDYRKFIGLCRNILETIKTKKYCK